MATSETVPFGMLLAALLERCGLSARQLAEHLDVQPSLVHAWIRGARIPRLRAPYLKALYAALALSPEEIATLEASQVTSLKLGPKGPVGTRRKDHVTSLLHPPEARYPFLPMTYEQSRVPKLDRAALKQGVIRGQDAVRAAAVTLLREAVSTPPLSEQGTQLIRTFSGPFDLFEDHQGWQALWSGTVRDALRAGWHATPIWTLERNPRRSIRLLSRLLEYLPFGTYTPHYTRRYGTSNPAVDYLLVPTRGILIMFTDDTQRYGSAVFSRDERQLSLYTEHLQRMRTEANPLLKAYPAHEGKRDAFLEQIASVDARSGDRFLIKDGPSAFTRPDPFYKPGSNWLRSTSDPDGTLRRRAERTNSFLADMAAGRSYRDVCTQRGIKRMLAGEYPRDDRERHPTFQPNRQDLVDHLTEMQRLLDEHKHYELAIIDDEETERLLPRFFWCTKGGTLLIEAFYNNDDGGIREMDLLIEESSIVDAFVEAGSTVWGEIEAIHKDRGWVSWWIGQQVEALKVANGQI